MGRRTFDWMMSILYNAVEIKSRWAAPSPIKIRVSPNSVLSILCQIKPAFVGICGTGMLARPLIFLQSDEVDEVCSRLE